MAVVRTRRESPCLFKANVCGGRSSGFISYLALNGIAAAALNDSGTRMRLISVELWMRAPWDGTRMAPAVLELGTDMRYVYSPLRGLVDVRGNE
jgi:hypothetical protein